LSLKESEEKETNHKERESKNRNIVSYLFYCRLEGRTGIPLVEFPGNLPPGEFFGLAGSSWIVDDDKVTQWRVLRMGS
jgi:hypothetical protein